MNLLFDLDGTLTDPELGIVSCIEYALEKMGRNKDDYSNLRRFIGPPLLDTFTEILGSKSEAPQAVAYYRERFSVQGLFETRCSTVLPIACRPWPMPDTACWLPHRNRRSLHTRSSATSS